jgi:CelD/BcsL family acetyltransferase involved in cellulose biosynthesis
MTETMLIDLESIADDNVGRWRGLASRAIEPNPFFEPEFILPARHLPQGPTHLLVVRRGEEWEACLPLVTGRWHRVLPASFAWQGIYGFLGTPLVARGAEPALATLLAGAAERAGRRVLVIERASADGPLGVALAAESRATHRLAERTVRERAVLRRRVDGEYLGHMKAHHLREFKRQRRRLSETLDGEVRASHRAGNASAVEAFLELEHRGWKGRADTAFSSVEGEARFFRESCGQFHSQGRLQLLELRAGDRVLAMKCNLVATPGSFAFKIAFDEEFARYSPGIQLELENINHFHRSGLKWMDSCADPTNAMINRLWPQRRSLQNLLYAPRGDVGAAMIRMVRASMKVRDRIR